MKTEIDIAAEKLVNIIAYDEPSDGPNSVFKLCLGAALEEIRVLRNEVNELTRKAITAKYGVKPCLCSCGKTPAE